MRSGRKSLFSWQDRTFTGNDFLGMRRSPTPSYATRDSAAIDWRVELDRHARWLRTVIMARCGEFQAVDDLFQEVAAAAVEQRAPLADPDKLAPWLYQLAVRQSLLYRRKQGRRRKLEENYAQRLQHSPEDGVRLDALGWLLADERRALVRRALRRLKPRDAEMLLLKYTEDWSYKELAKHLGISPSAVESRLHRARERLRRKLALLDVVEVLR